jgi:purine-binding chemotaxis protein CheW
MVDLVKVRKKAKEKKAEKENLSGGQAIPPVPGQSGMPVLRDKIAQFLETAGQRRIIKKEEVAEAKAQLELLTFAIAGEFYAADIEHVVEIVTPRPVTRIPNADPSIVGIFSLRGTIVTLIDVRRRLGHPPAGANAEDPRIIVVQHGGETVGFLVDRVLRVVKADADSIDPQPVAHASEQVESVRGVFRHEDSLTILLDLDKLLGGVATWN